MEKILFGWLIGMCIFGWGILLWEISRPKHTILGPWPRPMWTVTTRWNMDKGNYESDWKRIQ